MRFAHICRDPVPTAVTGVKKSAVPRPSKEARCDCFVHILFLEWLHNVNDLGRRASSWTAVVDILEAIVPLHDRKIAMWRTRDLQRTVGLDAIDIAKRVPD